MVFNKSNILLCFCSKYILLTKTNKISGTFLLITPGAVLCAAADRKPVPPFEKKKKQFGLAHDIDWTAKEMVEGRP